MFFSVMPSYFLKSVISVPSQSNHQIYISSMAVGLPRDRSFMHPFLPEQTWQELPGRSDAGSSLWDSKGGGGRGTNPIIITTNMAQ